MIEPPCPLHESHDISRFDCGVEALNTYLKQYAQQAQKRDGARTYVVRKDNLVVAYYTIVFGSIVWNAAPDNVRKGLGKYPIPVMIVARLAVDKRWADRGLGNP